jgi:hypothetical protein
MEEDFTGNQGPQRTVVHEKNNNNKKKIMIMMN